MTSSEKQLEPPRRGRPPRPGLAEQRREQLVETAYTIFLEKGYSAAGVQDITDRLGVATGTFYRYFSSKREILDAVIDFATGQMLGDLRLGVAPEPPQSLEEFIAVVRKSAIDILETIAQEPRMPRMLLVEAIAVDEEMSNRLFSLHDMMGSFTSGFIATGVERGYLRDDVDPNDVGRSINMMLTPIMFDMARGIGDAKSRARQVDEVMKVVIAGLLPQRDSGLSAP